MISESILACDLGGTRCRVAVVDRDGSVHSKRAISTPRDDPGALSRLMQSALREAGNDLAGAVIGVPGPVDYSRGEVLALPNLPNWEGKVSAHRISEELDIPVLIANDADLGGIGRATIRRRPWLPRHALRYVQYRRWGRRDHWREARSGEILTGGARPHHHRSTDPWDG